MRSAVHNAGEKARAGFTLIEILVTLAIVGVLLGFLYQIFITQQRTHQVQEEMADAQQNARVAVQELTKALASLGAGVDQATGQRRILLAQKYQMVFNADLSDTQGALAPGTTIPGSGSPGQTVPAGTFTASGPAETYRYTLDRNGDGVVDAADRTSGEHVTLYREINGNNGGKTEIALDVANARVEIPVFRYYGDFNGTGTPLWVDRVDASTSSRVAAGEPLDAVIRSIEVNLIAETEHKDPRYTQNSGYRQAAFKTAITPANLWDCPLIAPLTGVGALAAPGLLGTTLPLQFVVTRAGAPEPGRTVQFSITGPAGHGVVVTNVAGAATSDRTDVSGVVTAVVRWPTACPQLSEGIYTVTARTAAPPPLSTSFWTCGSHSTSVSFQVGRGLPAGVTFGTDPLQVDSCGASVSTTYHLVDGCGRVLDPGDYSANPINLSLSPDPAFGTLSATMLATEPGTLDYQSPNVPYSGFPTVTRSATNPNVFQASVQATNGTGSTSIDVVLRPSAIVNLTTNIVSTAFTDCPNPALPVVESFGVRDACGNLLHVLNGADAIGVSLNPPASQRGAIASPPNNRAAFLPDPFNVTRNDGTIGQPQRFSIQYQAPTCTVGGVPLDAQVLLDPSWSATGTQTLPLRVAACGGCSVSLTDRNGAPRTYLNGSCDGQSWVTVTECLPIGTTAEVVIEPEPGSLGKPSFDRDSAQDRVSVSFNAVPRGETAKVPIYTGTARLTDRFRVAAYIPDQATAQTPGGGVLCRSDALTVENRCTGILISRVASNPEAAKSTGTGSDTPLCAAEGATVFFRIRDCDENKYSTVIEKIRSSPGSSRGLLVRVWDGGTLLDEESPELTESTIHGVSSSDSPFFQGSLALTRNPADARFNGLLRVPIDKEATLEVQYVDPDDASDNLCLARALLIPPYPVCLNNPALSWADWQGDLAVHGGDAAVVGILNLPNPPLLILKDAIAPANPLPYSSLPRDRFFNAYVGGNISVGGSPFPPGPAPDQPFLPNSGNYFQNVPDAESLLTRLDYGQLKALAKTRGVYWEATAGGTSPQIRNPVTGVIGTFEEVTRLPGPGVASQTHDGRLIFVDAQPGFQSATAVDQASASQLPEHVVAGAFYSEGLLYVAGSVVFQSAAGQQTASIEVSSTLDSRYDEDTGGLTRQDLPIDFRQPSSRVAAGTLPVNLAGALYCDGRVTMAPGFRVYGVVAGEKGVTAPPQAELWYDLHWRETRIEPYCFQCCSLALTPVAQQVPVKGTLQLTTQHAGGSVTWQSLATGVAQVSSSGLVTGIAPGRATIRAVDDAGCVAETEVEVF